MIENLPPAVSLALHSIFAQCKEDPPVEWPVEAYRLINREDLALQAEVAEQISGNTDGGESLVFEALEKETAYTQCKPPEPENPIVKKDESDVKSGMEHLKTKLLRLLFPRDHRMTEVFNLLQSSTPVSINLTQRPEVSDHDFIEEQEKYLFALSTRIMALPVARGMVTLRSTPCPPTEALQPPKLCVSGKGPPPRCTAVDLPGTNTGGEPPSCLVWPSFHNGVAAGLALVPLAGPTIHPSWVIYNKPKGATDMSTEHAGFLMALGLNGHLKDMPFMNIYEYLVKCQEMTSIGLLLGLAATYRGTMDVQATKVMSIHLEPLLPPTSVELDVQQNIAVAALLGVGLLYQGTMHGHYLEVLLNEIGRAWGPEDSCEREGYALAAGLALGMLAAAGHRAAPGHLAATLRRHMLGEASGSASPRPRAGCNLDVTSPGATLALGLVFLGSGDRGVAAWLAAPPSPYLLDHCRPDLLMLRVIARGLILWNEIEPTEEWVEAQVPPTIKPYCFVKPTEDNIDYEAMNQAYCNIVGGACFALGVRFAGSGCAEARDTLLHYCRLLTRLSQRPLAELAGSATLEACLSQALIAAAMVMSGRGCVEVLRVCRALRGRVSTGGGHLQHLTHGGQMAVHAAVGLLFLGGCRCTLSTAPVAVAALLAAFFPKFPTHSEDNRYHLQAFRHLYVVAVEPRLLLPRDISTGKLCYAHLKVVSLDGVVTKLKAPCMLPELHSLKEVRIEDPRYWPIVFHKDRNWPLLQGFLKHSRCLDIKQKAGCLSYLDDPLGFLSILARTLTLAQELWAPDLQAVDLFSSDERVRSFSNHYLRNLVGRKEAGKSVCPQCVFQRKKKGCKSEIVFSRECECRKLSEEELSLVQKLSMITYECVLKDNLCVLPIWSTFLKILNTIEINPTTYHVWQIKMLLSQIESVNRRNFNQMNIDDGNTLEPLISNEFTFSMSQKVEGIFDRWEQKLTPSLKSYLGLPYQSKGVATADTKKFLASFIVYYNLPRNLFKEKVCDNYLSLIAEMPSLGLSSMTATKLGSLLA